MAITLHALRLADVGPDDRVLVTGAGPVGLLLVAVLRAQGISDVTVSEPSPVRRQQALDVGATRVVVTRRAARSHPWRCRCRSRTRSRSNARATPARPRRPSVSWTMPGTLVIVGTGFEPPRFNQNRLIIFELQIIGAYNYNDEGFQPAVDLLDAWQPAARGPDRARRRSAERSDGSMERLARGEIPSKVMVQPGLPS